MNNLTIEQKLEVVRKALEKGALIDLKFHDIKGPERAEATVAELSEMINQSYAKDAHNGANWISAHNYTDGIHVTVFYDLEDKKEKLKQELEALEYTEDDIYHEEEQHA
ncbi:hypothetical protein BKM15_26170 [Pseudomonas syringae pv. syringae]|nr:hypothetical protein BKM15_26170 [Pseudomonas syringae pv. syringae]